MLRLNSATGIIALVTTAVSAAVLLFGNIDVVAAIWGFTPAMVANPQAPQWWATPLTSALLHGNWLHLLANMVALLFIGGMVERVIGGAALVFAYVVGALAAVLAQYLFDPASALPMIGASGAISALFGLYALFFGAPKQVTSSQRLNRWIHVLWLLAAWIVLQWMMAVLMGGQGVLLATPAHIGGFVAGVILQRPILLWRYRKA